MADHDEDVRLVDSQQITSKPTSSAHRITPLLDRNILDAFCAECPSTACDLPGDQVGCATLLLIGSIWARGTGLHYALVAEHEAATDWQRGGNKAAWLLAHDNAERLMKGEG